MTTKHRHRQKEKANTQRSRCITLDRLFVFMQDVYFKSRTRFWAFVFLQGLSVLILGRRDHVLQPEEVFNELEEAYMEETFECISPEDFLFWAWADLKFEADDADAWALRRNMMKYHYKQQKELLSQENQIHTIAALAHP